MTFTTSNKPSMKKPSKNNGKFIFTKYRIIKTENKGYRRTTYFDIFDYKKGIIKLTDLQGPPLKVFFLIESVFCVVAFNNVLFTFFFFTSTIIVYCPKQCCHFHTLTWVNLNRQISIRKKNENKCSLTNYFISI